MKRYLLFLILLTLVFSFGCANEYGHKSATKKEMKSKQSYWDKYVKYQYEATWESLREYNHVPKWLRDGKFGIYTHWGPYAVHAYGSNTTWYSYALYTETDSDARRHFERNFGKLTKDFGYKDLIPKFTAEKFDADEWAELFEKAGAKFAGPVAEHHDGFAMWDTKYSEWNAANMGYRLK